MIPGFNKHRRQLFSISGVVSVIVSDEDMLNK